MLKNRIETIKEYFKEMQIVDVDGTHVIYVIVVFPNNWRIDKTVEEKFNVNISEGNYLNEYYFATEISNGEEKVFDAIDYNINIMKAEIERAELLKEKILELRSLFENEKITLNDLKTLKYVFENTFENTIKAETYKPKTDTITILENNQLTTEIKENKKDK